MLVITSERTNPDSVPGVAAPRAPSSELMTRNIGELPERTTLPQDVDAAATAKYRHEAFHIQVGTHHSPHPASF